jgi:hypothetical protein
MTMTTAAARLGGAGPQKRFLMYCRIWKICNNRGLQTLENLKSEFFEIHYWFKFSEILPESKMPLAKISEILPSLKPKIFGWPNFSASDFRFLPNFYAANLKSENPNDGPIKSRESNGIGRTVIPVYKHTLYRNTGLENLTAASVPIKSVLIDRYDCTANPI